MSLICYTCPGITSHIGTTLLGALTPHLQRKELTKHERGLLPIIGVCSSSWHQYMPPPDSYLTIIWPSNQEGAWTVGAPEVLDSVEVLKKARLETALKVVTSWSHFRVVVTRELRSLLSKSACTWANLPIKSCMKAVKSDLDRTENAAVLDVARESLKIPNSEDCPKSPTSVGILQHWSVQQDQALGIRHVVPQCSKGIN